MKRKNIGMALTCMTLGAILCGTSVPARAAETSASATVQTATLKVSSYKGNALVNANLKL